ncbi:MAG: hypothetical protein CL429_03185 [Acidimicrobiaceae bacterium]|nr:hypothetical protein [Acidimicrobiaceae bacterium]
MKKTFASDSTMAITWRGGEGQLAAQGSFGSGTLTLEYSLDAGSTWTLLESDPASSLSAAGSFAFRSMRTDDTDYMLRLSLTGSTSPSINAKIGDNLN